jgi:para-nitrobenzyl esterase|tara:strand:+ start:48 stop:1874 length:1827 start_codon:yes stop_codon:yes gene_type:complete
MQAQPLFYIYFTIGLLAVSSGFAFYERQYPIIEPTKPDTATLRTTSSGNVIGYIGDGGAYTWKGIPYAQAPQGLLRWRAPVPAQPSRTRSIIEALATGPACPQFASLLSGQADAVEGSITGVEDCLYLNIYAPPNAENLPVMYWIHGGGNSIGQGSSYNGSNLAMQRDVIVVTINYRLGVFGWFTHPALRTGNPEDDSGNYGTLDAIQGLKWVRENISQFGGNPNNVTVFGESAGGRDTLAMMASPLAKGLFHRAIVQSGSYSSNKVAVGQNYVSDGGHPFSAKEIISKLLVADGTVDSLEAAKSLQADMSRSYTQQYLHNKSVDEIFQLFDSRGFGMINFPDNFADGSVLPDLSVEELFSNLDNHNAVPIILGTNRDEPSLFMASDPRHIEKFLGFLPRLKDKDVYKRAVKYGALTWKAQGVDNLAEYMTKAGNQNVYAYRFDWDEEPSQLGFDLSTALGAAHGLEIAFAFNDFEGGFGIDYIYPHDDNQAALANSMGSYWSEFALNGNPMQGQDGKQPMWVSWSMGDMYSLVLDTPEDQGIFMNKEIVSLASVKEALTADTSIHDETERCRLYVRNFRNEAFSSAEYNALGNGVCAEIDPNTISRF